MEETEIRLAKELSEVCRDYCDVTWDKALSAAGVSADSTLRQPGSMYYHPDICVAPGAIPSSTAIAQTLLSNPLLSKLLSLPLRLQRDPARLVIKARGLREVKTRVMVRRKSPPQKPRMPSRKRKL